MTKREIYNCLGAVAYAAELPPGQVKEALHALTDLLHHVVELQKSADNERRAYTIQPDFDPHD